MHLPKRANFSLISLAILLVTGSIIGVALSQNQEIRQRASISNNADLEISAQSNSTLTKGGTKPFDVKLTPNAALVKKADIIFHFDSTLVDIVSFAPISTSKLPTVTSKFSVAIPSDSPTQSWARITLENTNIQGAMGSPSTLGTLTVKCKQIGTSKIDPIGTKISRQSDSGKKVIDLTGSLTGTIVTCVYPAGPTPTNAPTPLPTTRPVYTADLLISAQSNSTLTKGGTKPFDVILKPNSALVNKADIIFHFDSTLVDIVSFAPISTSKLPTVTSKFSVAIPSDSPTQSWAKVTLVNQNGAMGSPSTLGTLTVKCKQIGTSKFDPIGTKIVKQGENKEVNLTGSLTGTIVKCVYPTPTPTPT